MGEVVNEHVRFGRLIVRGVNAPRALLVFSHELTGPLDLGGKRCDSVRDWFHGVLGQLETAALLVGKTKRLDCHTRSSSTRGLRPSRR
jgi:hypothetical protein